jgi:hypothetical protein
MCNKIKKFRFNLVEITLAVAVLAIGMGSILVLFPVGVNSHKEAIANNNLSDISEYILGFFEAKVMEDWASLTNGNQFALAADGTVDRFNEYPSRTTGFIFGSLTSEANRATGVQTEGLSKGDSVEGYSANSPQWQRARFFRTSRTGVFIYEQATVIDGERVPDFSAIIRTWRTPLEISLANGSTTPIDTNFNFGVSLNLEISWPAEAPYAQRETRFYKLDLFNPYYTPVTPN